MRFTFSCNLISMFYSIFTVLLFYSISTSHNFVWKCFIRYMNFVFFLSPEAKRPLFAKSTVHVIRSEIWCTISDLKGAKPKRRYVFWSKCFVWPEMKSPQNVLFLASTTPSPSKALPLPVGVIVHFENRCYRMCYILVCQINADYYAKIYLVKRIIIITMQSCDIIIIIIILITSDLRPRNWLWLTVFL